MFDSFFVRIGDFIYNFYANPEETDLWLNNFNKC